MDIEAELKHLKRRVDDLEGVVNDLAGQVRAVHPELLALKSETTRRFDVADGHMARIVHRLDSVNTQVWSLRDDLPLLIRRAFDERDRRSASNDD
jgi:hypothetical protein